MRDVAEQTLLSQINRDELTALVRSLVQANSENPPGRENAVARRILEYLNSADCSVYIQRIEGSRSNIIATIEGETPEKLLLCGHMDTVPAGDLRLWKHDPWGAVMRQNRLYGLGACDMKAGLAAMLAAFKAVASANKRKSYKRGLRFAAVIDEEVGFAGTKRLIADGFTGDCKMACIAEPTGNRIAVRLKGAIEFAAATYGRSAHTGIAYEGDNAIVKMVRYVEALHRYGESLKLRHYDEELQHPTVNIGRIQGGVGVTLVPDRCEIEFDRQVLPNEKMQDAEDEIRSLTESVNRAEGIGVELAVRQRFNHWQVSEKEEWVRSLANAVRCVRGEIPRFAGFNGYAEVELLAAHGVPSVLFGPGSLRQAHAPNEYVELKELFEAADVFALWAHRWMRG